jgi:hypothetical protein
MAKIRKSKIYWKPSTSPHLAGYKLYWEVGGNVNYGSEHADVGLRTEIVLPDDVPSFPFVNGSIDIGITAVTDRGNESDMAKMSASFDFSLPEAPSEIEAKDMEDFFFRSPATTSPITSEIEEPEKEEWPKPESDSGWRP